MALNAKPSRRPIPIFEIVAVLLVLAGYAGITYMEVRANGAESAIDTQSTYDARPGGYRALFEFLQAEGVRVERFERRPAYVDDAIDTYVIASSPFGIVGLTPADEEALARWVKAGGRLVVIGDSTFLGGLKLPLPQDATVKNDRARTVIASPLTAGVTRLEGESSRRILLGDAQTQTPLAADKAGLVASAYAYGSGTIVLITDESLFQNRNLARADNARFALDVIAGGQSRNAVAAIDEFSHGYQIGDSLWSVLPAPMREGAVILAGALLVLLVGAFFRFGPVVRLPVETERTSSEYLSSMATLLERGHATRIALRSVADSCLRDLAAALGLNEGAPVARVAEAVRRRPGGDALADGVLELNRLRSYERPTDAELLAAVRVAATLRKEHAPYARIGFGRRPATARRSA
ncbi:MAG: DUF4350 domain-containing protein [Candidatus Eremiobacteraeota bacterium]|nr:DUF4350 domain-containing protein [Candidatus Eremiobacteraeota bacterium]